MPQSLFVPVAIAFLLVIFVWTGALTITVFDLEWLEHPATSTRWFQVALGATLVAMVMPALIALIQFAGLGVPFPIPYVLLFLGVGLSLLVHNIEARRAHLLHGVLPWVGIVSGAFFVFIGVLQTLVLFTTAFVMFWLFGLIAAQLTYLVWAIWLGVHLTRAKAATAAKAAPA